MKENAICITQNIKALDQAYQELLATPKGVEKIALVHGHSGFGKSTALKRLMFRHGGIYLEATPLWTPNVLLRKLCVELGKEVRNRNQDMLDAIQASLRLNRRTIFIDEVDMLFDCRNVGRMLETIRSVYNVSYAPIVLVGMDLIAKKIGRWPQLNRRITQEVQFRPLDMTDARALADECYEVHIQDDLLLDLHKTADGNCGYMVNGLDKIERRARRLQLDSISLADWREKGATTYFLDRRK